MGVEAGLSDKTVWCWPPSRGKGGRAGWGASRNFFAAPQGQGKSRERWGVGGRARGSRGALVPFTTRTIQDVLQVLILKPNCIFRSTATDSPSAVETRTQEVAPPSISAICLCWGVVRSCVCVSFVGANKCRPSRDEIRE